MMVIVDFKKLFPFCTPPKKILNRLQGRFWVFLESSVLCRVDGVLRITCVARDREKTSSREQTLFGANKHGFVYFSLSENKAFEETDTLCQTSHLLGE